MKLRYWLAVLVAALVLAAGAAAAAIPGPQRAICPQCFGLTDIGGDIFTDAPGRAGELRALVKEADNEVGAFFGDLASHPRYVFCTTADCLATFGGGSTGLTYGSLLIRVAPQGLESHIVTHERLHAEIAARAGARALLGEAVPVWFDEGLAAYLARDPRYPGPFSADDIAWIKAGVTRDQWNMLLGSRDWIAGYGAAQAAVADLDKRLGRGRLHAVVQLLVNGHTLAQALTIVGG